MTPLSIGGIKFGMLCVDLFDARAAIRRPIWETGLESAAFSWIEAIHVLEHCPSAYVLPALVEINRLLSSSGSAAICVPNVIPVMRRWVDNPTWPLPAVLYGSQTREGQFHHCAFSPETPSQVLREAGLRVESVEVIAKGSVRTVCAGDPACFFVARTLTMRPGILAHARKGVP